jgi:hypothetical protein
MSLARWSPILVAGCWLAVLGRGDETTERSAVQPIAAADPAGSPFRGSGSCSATACHGSISRLDRSVPDSRVRRNEHTTWISDDPHSRAYQVLFGELSERIERNLAGGAGSPKPAPKDERCLACHTTPRPAAALAATSWMNADGVGCESCHGRSAEWLGPHTTYGWRDKGWPEKAKLKMENTRDLAARAEICAGCHVGSHSPDGLPVRDVNHDLIAAGHPRLNFEFAAFLANMPAHWEEKDEKGKLLADDPAGAAAFPARAWAIGRLATVKAALELLEARAAKAQCLQDRLAKPAAAPEPLALPLAGADTPGAPWPEFTEYGCFACHHDLRDEAWRRRARTDGIKPGTPSWGSWTLPLTRELLDELVPLPVAGPYTESLRPLSEEMAKPGPDPGAIQEKFLGCDLRLMSSVKDARDIPSGGKNLIIVAAVNRVLHFRIFDGDGKMAADTDETRLTEKDRPIEGLRKRLETLWPPHELTGCEKRQVIDAVTSIVGHTRIPKVIVALDRCLEELTKKRFDAAEVKRLIERLDDQGAWGRVASWDEACQRYLALEALRQAWVGLAPDRKAEQDGLRIRLERLLCQLMFEEGYDSPQCFDSTGLRDLMAR